MLCCLQGPGWTPTRGVARLQRPWHGRLLDGRRTLFQLPGSAGRQVAARAGAAAAGSDSTQPSTPAAPAASDPSAPATEVTLAVRCQAAFGDTVAVVGEAPELGAWDPAAGVALTWGEGNVWTARLRLAPGAFSFKVVRLLARGGVEWEGGDNRSCEVPELSPLLADCSEVRVACTYGDPVSTHVEVAPDKARLQELASSILGRANDLSQRRHQLHERMRHLEEQVEESDAALNQVWQRMRDMAEQQQLKKRRKEEQQEGEVKEAERELAAVGAGASASAAAATSPAPPTAPAPAGPADSAAFWEEEVGASARPGAAGDGPGEQETRSSEQDAHRRGVHPHHPAEHDAEGHKRLPWYITSSVWESETTSSDEEAAVASLHPGPHMHIVVGPLRPAFTPSMSREASSPEEEGEMDWGTAAGAGAAGATETAAAAAAGAEGVTWAAAGAGAAGAAAAAQQAAAAHELRPELPGLRELSAAADGTLTFCFEEGGPSAVELAAKYSVPGLPPAAMEALQAKSLVPVRHHLDGSRQHPTGGATAGDAPARRPASPPDAGGVGPATNGGPESQREHSLS